MLIDCMVQEMYSCTKSGWDENRARQSAHAMLELVEKYKSISINQKPSKWRASD